MMKQIVNIILTIKIVLAILLTSQAVAQDSLKSLQINKADVNATYRLAEGNISQRMFMLRTALLAQNKYWALEPSFNYSLNQIFSNQLESDIFTWMIVKYLPDNKFFPIVAGFYENSRLRSIQLRYSAGGGIGYHVWQKQSLQLELFQMASYFTTRFEVNSGLDYSGAANHFGYRASIELVKEKLIFQQQLYSLFLYNDPANYSIRAFNSLLIPVSNKLMITLNLEYLYESVVDEGRKNLNMLSSGGILYSLKHNAKK